jgi:2-(1,2-epoxy-1,2-dihydrophenyl)acetyl-CoA isomerase
MAELVGTFYGFETAIDDGIAVVTFNRPERKNGFLLTTKRELTEWLTHAQFAADIRVIVFTGAGGNFSAGDDISGKPTEQELAEPKLTSHLDLGQRGSMRTYDAIRLAAHSLVRMLRAMDKFTIAAIDGYAIQSGLTVALSCDFRIATERAKLGSGTLRFALAPDDGCHYLIVQQLGLSRAMDFIMRNRIVSAEEAQALGLVGQVVSPESLLPTAREVALELSALPQVAARFVKRSLYVAAASTFEQALEDTATKTAITDYHPDASEGFAAFREKRPAHYNAWLEND